MRVGSLPFHMNHKLGKKNRGDGAVGAKVVDCLGDKLFTRGVLSGRWKGVSWWLRGRALPAACLLGRCSLPCGLFFL